FGDYQHLADRKVFKPYLAPLWKTDWFVYAKRPFAGPQQVLAYLSRYTHRVAISNSRLISADATGVTFKYKDYRIEGPDRYKTIPPKRVDFTRWSRMPGLPKVSHRIRHYGEVWCESGCDQPRNGIPIDLCGAYVWRQGWSAALEEGSRDAAWSFG